VHRIAQYRVSHGKSVRFCQPDENNYLGCSIVPKHVHDQEFCRCYESKSNRNVYRFGTCHINWYVLKGDDGLLVAGVGPSAHRPQFDDFDANSYRTTT